LEGAGLTIDGLILVCDDDSERVKRWSDLIGALPEVASAFEVCPMAPHRFAQAFRGLQSRRAAARSTEVVLASGSGAETLDLIDRADVLVVDYDLTPDRDRAPDPVEDESSVAELSGRSGEEFAYLARCFSSAGAIVVVNQRVQRRVFDLTLQQFADSFANVNITAHHLDSVALWVGGSGGFRPWSWPRLLDLPELVRRRAELIEDLDRPILAALGLDDEVNLYAFTQAQLDPLGNDPLATTFREVAQSSEYGLSAKDQGTQLEEDAVRRVAASAVARWLEWRVVPGQNVLIDAPHLSQRFPGLLTGDVGDVETWNRTAQLGAGLDPGLSPGALDGASVVASRWTSRQVWSLPKLMAGGSLFRSIPSGGPTYVFCEDTSRFMDLDTAVEVEVAVPSPYTQRFVEMVDGVDYTPRGRIRP
jgi:hypothetical protein